MGELVDAAAGGDRRATLTALRDLLASEIEGADAKDIAALTRQLRQVMAELDTLADGEEGDAVDEVAARRTARRAAAANRDHPAPHQQRGPGGD